MVTIKDCAHGVDIYDVWYAQDNVKYKGIIHYRQAMKSIGNNSDEFVTLENDLGIDEDAIIAGITKNGRYEIRRAERENIETNLYLSNEIEESDIDEFINFFEEFWSTKGVNYAWRDSLKKELLAYKKINALAIGTARMGESICVYHTYIVDDKRVRLLHSASLYRTSDDVPKSILGMANRLLHKNEMLRFKELGKEIYDWGGAGTSQDVIGITEFKKSFGGTQKIYFDSTLACGIKAKLVMAISAMKGKSNKN